jgi:ribosomal protein S18 acetylase RimI-like enzyme
MTGTSTTDGAYNNSDREYREICEFLNRLAERDPCALWESGRMNFWRHNVHARKPQDDPFFSENAHVWRSGNGEVVGLCISEYGRNDMFIEVLPDYREIYSDMLRWVTGEWAAARTDIEIDLFSEDAWKIRRLEADGFAFLRHFENVRYYDLEKIDLGYELEEGFTIRTLSSARDRAGRVALVRSVFENPDYSERNLNGLMKSPDYIDAYNLSVFSPEGEQVAYCIGWHDQARDRAGYIEPVGTHEAYRGRGLAKAVVKECFTRLKANGIATVEISSRAEPAVANFLYESLSPYRKRKVLKYGKKVP